MGDCPRNARWKAEQDLADARKLRETSDPLTTALARAESLEQKVCDFQAASMLDVGNQGGPCRVEPEHVESHIKELRAKVESLEAELLQKVQQVERAEKACAEWALGVEQSNTDIVDMQRDEFRRIIALDPSDEIKGICERAIKTIEQTVPVVVQRDQLETRNRQIVQAMEKIIAQQPCMDGGSCFYPMHDGEGNYIGEQNVDPLSVVQTMAQTAQEALALLKEEMGREG